jgi:hypothetical protein
MFILYNISKYSHFNILFSKPCQRQYELLSTLGVRRLYVHSLERTFHRYFLPSFSSFGWEFSEEKIKMWKVNGWQTTDTKWWQKLILSLAKFAKKNIKMWIPTCNVYNEHVTVMIHYQTWLPQAILVSDWPTFKNLLLWNRLAKWTGTC